MDQAKQRERDNQQVKEEKMVSSMILASNGTTEYGVQLEFAWLT
jgi:hypothetical protein